MPTAQQTRDNYLGELLALMSNAGKGKSTFVMQSPQPHAILCVDKPIISPLPANFPDYDPNLSFGKFYPPPDKDLKDDKQLPPRNVFDQFIADIQALKMVLRSGEPKFKMGDEEWLLPQTIIVEGMDFVRKHATNWVLNVHKKYHMDEFTTAKGDPNPWLGWGLVAEKMLEVYNNLSFLPSIRPVNVVVTVGLDEETKQERVNGRVETVKTGKVDPAFGGKQSIEAPRKFRDCWLAHEAAGKYWLVVAAVDKYESYRGLRSGRFWPPELATKGLVDVTLDMKNPVNQWNRIFHAR